MPPSGPSPGPRALRGAKTPIRLAIKPYVSSRLCGVSVIYVLLRRRFGLFSGATSREASKDVEIAVLRHQLKVLRGRWRAGGPDRWTGPVLAAAAGLRPRER
jgi:hypothetical protein